MASAFRATGLRPTALVLRQGTSACALGALLECLGGAGEGDPVERWAPLSLRAWWRGFQAGWDFPPETEVQSPLSLDPGFRQGRAVGGLVRCHCLTSPVRQRSCPDSLDRRYTN